MSKTRGYIYHYVNKQKRDFSKHTKIILPCLPKISMGFKQQGLANKLPS